MSVYNIDYPNLYTYENTPKIVNHEKAMHMSMVTMVVGAILATALCGVGISGLLHVSGLPNITGSIALIAVGSILGLPWLVSGAAGTIHQRRKIDHLQDRLSKNEKTFIANILHRDATYFTKNPDNNYAEKNFNACQQRWKNTNGVYLIYKRPQGYFFIVKTYQGEMLFTPTIAKIDRDTLQLYLTQLGYENFQTVKTTN